MKNKRKWIQISMRSLLFFVITGIICGFVITMYKLGINHFAKFMLSYLKICNKTIYGKICFVLTFIVLGTVIYFMNNLDSMIKGSGIPVVYGIIDAKFKVNWEKTLVYKFVSSVLTVGSGMTLGREGPSVQIGGLVGEAVHKLSKESEEDERYYVGASAGAGLAVAFNAPITGVLFSVEEIFKKTNRKVFLSASVIVFCAVITSNLLLGNHPTLVDMPKIAALNMHTYIYVALIGILSGISGVLFNYIIIDRKDVFHKVLPLNKYFKFLVPFVVTAIILLIDGTTFGAGEHFLSMNMYGSYSIQKIVVLYLLKIFLLYLSFAVGVPGGSLVPLLVIGALLGNFYASILCTLGIIPPSMVIVFVMLAMCGHFSSIVRAPIAGIILILEMTGGSFEYLLSLAIVSLLAYTIAEALGKKPFYEDLYERMLGNR